METEQEIEEKLKKINQRIEHLYKLQDELNIEANKFRAERLVKFLEGTTWEIRVNSRHNLYLINKKLSGNDSIPFFYGYHDHLNVGENVVVSLDDNDWSIYSENFANVVKFCKENKIKVDLKDLEVEIDKLSDKLDWMNLLLNGLLNAGGNDV